MNENAIEGRNAVLEAFRAGKTVDKLYVQEGLKDGPILSIVREAKKQGSRILYSDKESLNRMSEDGKHQGVIAMVASYSYAELGDILEGAREKGEDPFLILLDGIEDPYNLGAIIRTANQVGAHGVIINKNRGRADRECCENLRGGAELHAGREGHEYGAHHRGAEKGRALVCRGRYGRRRDVQSESEGAAGFGHRQRGQGGLGARPEEV